LFTANDAYLQARLQHLQAIVGLYQSFGGGWSKGQSDAK
jgi:outer membrane protein TolC